jgi:lipoprotein-anchoring transpeptidase ErfK/SrfK
MLVLRAPATTQSAITRLRPIGFAVAAFLLAMAAWYAAQVVVLNYSAAAAVNANVGRAVTPLKLDGALQVTVRGAGVQLEGAQLFRADQADDGSRSAEQAVPTRLEQNGDEGTWQIVAADAAQLLLPDGAYRLAVRIAAPRPAIPLPRTDFVEQQYRFTTVASPHASVPTTVVRPGWAEPVSFTWSEPMQAVTATVLPTAPLNTWIDAGDSRKTWVQLGDETGAGITDGQTYEVRVADARARDGIALQRPIAFKVAIPERPRFVDPPTQQVTLRYGDAFTLKSSMELTQTQVTMSEGAPARVSVGRDDIRVDMPQYQQGAEFDVRVVSGTSLQGAPLAEPVQMHFTTPPALSPPTVIPDDGSIGVQPSAHPSIAFPEAVADPAAATRALQIDPPVAGQWQWISPSQVEFIPDTRLPILTDVTINVHGGPNGPRTAAGGYLDNDVSTTFRTTDYKRMDVSLSRQTMTLFENDAAVRTIYVATGVAAAPTPTGTFYVQYKSSQMRFRGVNPDGSHYDIPDVHWVMPFWGDYTIHGAYWRARFGTPGSDGCISMTDADAKMLFDWADVGTPIVIHS